MKKVFDKINGAVAFFEKILLVVILSVIIGVSFYQVILRNFFDTGITLADIITRQLLLWICFLGASLSTYYRSHIKIDLLRVLPFRAKKLLTLLTDLFAFIICGWLGYAGYAFFLDEYNFASMLAKNLPRWVFMIVIPVWFFIMSCRFLLHFFTDLRLEDEKK